MHLRLHKKTGDGDAPIYVCAEDIQTIEWVSPAGTMLRLIGGVTLEGISESPREILEFLQLNLQERWG